MKHELVPNDAPPRTERAFKVVTRASALRAIDAVSDDKSEMKERIMLARECGIISAFEAREMIVKNGLEHS